MPISLAVFGKEGRYFYKELTQFSNAVFGMTPIEPSIPHPLLPLPLVSSFFQSDLFLKDVHMCVREGDIQFFRFFPS